ncbi:MAG: glutathione S-transferase family protein [Pseudomonadota bacterium]
MKPKLVIGNKKYSSWSLRAWLLMSEAGINFEEHRIPLDTPGTKSAIAEFSDAGLVPILAIGDERIWDTLAIAETLNERYPDNQLWPSDASARAHARSVAAEMHSGFPTLRHDMPMNCRAMGRRVHLPDALTRDIDRVFAIWSDCQRRYDGPWLFGEFSIADAMYAPVVLRFRTYGINIPDAAGYYPQRLLQSEAMQAWLLDAESETEVIEAEEVGQ